MKQNSSNSIIVVIFGGEGAVDGSGYWMKNYKSVSGNER